jgi:hypothetical protein
MQRTLANQLDDIVCKFAVSSNDRETQTGMASTQPPSSFEQVRPDVTLAMVLGSLGRRDMGYDFTPSDGDCLFTAVGQCCFMIPVNSCPTIMFHGNPPIGPLNYSADDLAFSLLLLAKGKGHWLRSKVASLLRSNDPLRMLAAHNWDTLLSVLPSLVRYNTAGKEAVARMQADGVDEYQRLECLAGLFRKPCDEGGIWATEIAVRAVAMIVQRDIFVVRVTNGRIASFLHYSKEPPTGDLAYTSIRTGRADVHMALRLPKAIFDIRSIVLANDGTHYWPTHPNECYKDSHALSDKSKYVSHALSDRCKYFSSNCPTEGDAFLCSLETFLHTECVYLQSCDIQF